MFEQVTQRQGEEREARSEERAGEEAGRRDSCLDNLEVVLGEQPINAVLLDRNFFYSTTL